MYVLAFQLYGLGKIITVKFDQKEKHSRNLLHEFAELRITDDYHLISSSQLIRIRNLMP